MSEEKGNNSMMSKDRNYEREPNKPQLKNNRSSKTPPPPKRKYNITKSKSKERERESYDDHNKLPNIDPSITPSINAPQENYISKKNAARYLKEFKISRPHLPRERGFVLDCCAKTDNLMPKYNGLMDGNLAGYFDRPKQKRHLLKMKFVDKSGEIIPNKFSLLMDGAPTPKHRFATRNQSTNKSDIQSYRNKQSGQLEKLPPIKSPERGSPSPVQNHNIGRQLKIGFYPSHKYRTNERMKDSRKSVNPGSESNIQPISKTQLEKVFEKFRKMTVDSGQFKYARPGGLNAKTSSELAAHHYKTQISPSQRENNSINSYQF